MRKSISAVLFVANKRVRSYGRPRPGARVPAANAQGDFWARASLHISLKIAGERLARQRHWRPASGARCMLGSARSTSRSAARNPADAGGSPTCPARPWRRARNRPRGPPDGGISWAIVLLGIIRAVIMKLASAPSINQHPRTLSIKRRREKREEGEKREKKKRAVFDFTPSPAICKCSASLWQFIGAVRHQSPRKSMYMPSS